jgi:hypothetical protein
MTVLSEYYIRPERIYWSSWGAEIRKRHKVAMQILEGVRAIDSNAATIVRALSGAHGERKIA